MTPRTGDPTKTSAFLPLPPKTLPRNTQLRLARGVSDMLDGFVNPLAELVRLFVQQSEQSLARSVRPFIEAMRNIPPPPDIGLEAHEAYEAAEAGDNTRLENLLTQRLHIPSDSYAYLAGYNELRRGLEGDWRRRPPWLRHDSPNPTGYLHKAITNEARRAKNREEEKERLWGGLKSEPIVDHDVVTNQLQSVEDVRSDPTILNADMIRVIEFLTQDRNPSTRACAVWTLRLLPEGVGPVDVVRAAGVEWWEYQEFQRKAQLWRKKFGKVS